ncbi:MAG: DUF4079 domain-containing protein [Synechococcus sp.]|nr:DUF4079 domain-containing protein [Synechococcus sp.]
MTAIDWLGLLHPVLVILFVYPVAGATVRLGILVRERRLGISRQPDPVPVEHADHGAWVAVGVVTSVLIALVYSLFSHAPSLPVAGGAAAGRPLLLLLAAGGTLAALLGLLRARRPLLRAGFCWITWAGLLALGSQPEIWRVSDNPFTPGFWSSHYWSGVLLCGLLLATTAARPEISRRPAWRRLHLGLNLLLMLLLVVQAITGSRDLLEIPLRWQKPFLQRCDWVAQRCPAPARQAAAAPGMPP